MKKAFTMSEVLITLGIIGIVAAMTLPSLIGNYQKKQTVAQLKKFYSVMSQAINRAEIDYGDVKYWDFGKNNETIKFFNLYLRPYLNIMKTYEVGEFPSDITYYCISGGSCTSYGDVDGNPKFVLSDGTMIISTDFFVDATGKVPGINVLVDINGFKGPNRYGRDVFAFSIQHEKKFVPAGIGYTSALDETGEYDRDWIMNGNSRGCSRNKNGFWCAALIMMDGWEIKDDYPW